MSGLVLTLTKLRSLDGENRNFEEKLRGLKLTKRSEIVFVNRHSEAERGAIRRLDVPDDVPPSRDVGPGAGPLTYAQRETELQWRVHLRRMRSLHQDARRRDVGCLGVLPFQLAGGSEVDGKLQWEAGRTHDQERERPT